MKCTLSILYSLLKKPIVARMYFTEPSDRIVGRINETHCLVRARKTR